MEVKHCYFAEGFQLGSTGLICSIAHSCAEPTQHQQLLSPGLICSISLPAPFPALGKLRAVMLPAW